MRYIVQVTDYHYGGLISFVILIDNTEYGLTTERSKASIFHSPRQLVDIRSHLIDNGRRTIEMEQIVNNDVLNHLVDI